MKAKQPDIGWIIRFLMWRDGKKNTICEPLEPGEIDSPAIQAAIIYFTGQGTPVIVREVTEDE
jgi:hypothetical protein